MNSANNFRPAMSDNSTAAAFTAKVPTTTNPSANTGFHDLAGAGKGYCSNGKAPDYLNIQPFATAANDVTFSMRVWGWRKNLNTENSNVDKWFPELLVELACVAGNISHGASNTFICDTITKAKGGDDPDIINCGNDLPASAIISLRGHQLIEFDFSINSGTATAMNAMWCPVDRL